MKLALFSMLLMLTGCAIGTDISPNWQDSGTVDAGSKDTSPETSCPHNACGKITDPATGITTDCGGCGFHSECGDNDIPNVCGAACLPSLGNDNKPTTQSCDYVLDPNGISGDWTNGLGTAVQYPGACNFTNPAVCIGIEILPSPNCRICGQYVCCISNPAAGFVPLLPGAVYDGGLPQ